MIFNLFLNASWIYNNVFVIINTFSIIWFRNIVKETLFLEIANTIAEYLKTTDSVLTNNGWIRRTFNPTLCLVRLISLRFIKSICLKWVENYFRMKEKNVSNIHTFVRHSTFKYVSFKFRFVIWRTYTGFI